LLIGGLLFILVLLFFIVRKKKQSTIKKQLEADLLAQQHQTEIDAELLEDNENEIDTSDSILVPTAENIDLYSKLVFFYQNEKPYLNANLKAIDVAKALNTSPRTITAIIKANGFNGFNNFNNKYRVEEVIRQFNDPNYLYIKMEAISSNAGFGNRQTFYNAFEEFTGLNPGYYRSEFLKQ
jgi:AraC-like DNA-binding protein